MQNGGVISVLNCIYYEGAMQNGQPIMTGRVKMRFANGNEYEGNIREGQANGEGKMTYANGNIYEGEWLNSETNGKGKMRYANGNTYDGEWLNGQANGVGEITDASGNKITGKFTNGVINGYARVTSRNGFSYREYDNQGILIRNNIPEETIEDLKRFHVGYSYL